MPVSLSWFGIVQSSVCVYICMDLDSPAVLDLELFLTYTSCSNTYIILRVTSVNFDFGFDWDF